MRAAGSVRDRGVNVGSIDSRVSLKEGTFGVSVIPRAAFVFTPDWCASSPPALSPLPLGGSGFFAVCARSSAPFVCVHILLELGAQHTSSPWTFLSVFVSDVLAFQIHASLDAFETHVSHHVS